MKRLLKSKVSVMPIEICGRCVFPKCQMCSLSPTNRILIPVVEYGRIMRVCLDCHKDFEIRRDRERERFKFQGTGKEFVENFLQEVLRKSFLEIGLLGEVEDQCYEDEDDGLTALERLQRRVLLGLEHEELDKARRRKKAAEAKEEDAKQAFQKRLKSIRDSLSNSIDWKEYSKERISIESAKSKRLSSIEEDIERIKKEMRRRSLERD